MHLEARLFNTVRQGPSACLRKYRTVAYSAVWQHADNDCAANVQRRIPAAPCPIGRGVYVKSRPSSGSGRRRRGCGVAWVPGVCRLAEAIFGSVSRGGCLSLPPGQTLRTAARPASASCVLSSILHRDIRSPAGRSSFTTDLHAKKNQKDPPRISAQSSRYVLPFL